MWKLVFYQHFYLYIWGPFSFYLLLHNMALCLLFRASSISCLIHSRPEVVPILHVASPLVLFLFLFHLPPPSLPNSIPLILWDSALTWHRWTSCLAAPHYSLSNDLNADRADVCLYSMPLRWPPVQRRSGGAPERKRKLILASRNDLLCSRFGLGRQAARHQPLISSLITGCLVASAAATPALTFLQPDNSWTDWVHLQQFSAIPWWWT